MGKRSHSELFLTRLKAWRSKNGLTQEQAAAALQLTRSYYNTVETGAREPGEGLKLKFELVENAPVHSVDTPRRTLAYSEDPDGTVSRVIERPREYAVGSSRTIRVLSWVQAGQITDYDELPEDWQGSIATDCPDPRAFGVEIRGDSMEPRFGQGEVVIAMPSFRPRYHDFVIARLADGGAVFKLFNANSSDETIVLTSLNPLYTPIHLREEQITWCYPVWGVFRKLWIAPSESFLK